MSAASTAEANQTSTSAFDRPRLNDGQTQGAPARARAWSADQPSRSTEVRGPGVENSDDDVEFEKLYPRRKEAHVPMDDKSRWAHATVLKVEPESVTCEIRGVDRHWEVSLPRSFFANSVRYGTSVRIGMQSVNGYRTPVVESLDVQPVHDPDLERLRAELEAI
jgi:hypothetical protein